MIRVLIVVGATLTAALGQQAWVPYFNERFGFSLRYPADVFASERQSDGGDGEMFTGDGGRLLVGAFENVDGYSLPSYRDLVRSQSYAGYHVSYTRQGQTWFVLSGENNQNVFYEKVMFSCRGKIINSFALVYPIDRKRLFDPIVERIEDTFRPGSRC
jgi:hypothetical protein